MLDCKLLGPQVLQTKSSNMEEDWWRSMAFLTHQPTSLDRTSGCLGEVMLDKLSMGPKPLAAAVLGSVIGSAVGGGSKLMCGAECSGACELDHTWGLHLEVGSRRMVPCS